MVQPPRLLVRRGLTGPWQFLRGPRAANRCRVQEGKAGLGRESSTPSREQLEARPSDPYAPASRPMTFSTQPYLRASRSVRWFRVSWLALLLLVPAPSSFADPGLVVTFRREASALDSLILSNAGFYVRSGEVPTSFLEPGPFRATLSGGVGSELKGEYRFQVETSGSFHLEINGAAVLDVAAPDSKPHLSDWI